MVSDLVRSWRQFAGSLPLLCLHVILPCSSSGRGGLGSLAPLGRPSLPSTLGSGLDSLSLGGSISGPSTAAATNPLNKPRLGISAAATATGPRVVSPRGTTSATSSSFSSPKSPSHTTSNSHSPSSSQHSPSSPASATATTAGRILPVKFAVKFHPPTLAMEYRDRGHPSRSRNRVRVWSLQGIFPPSVDARSSSAAHAGLTALAKQMAEKYPEYLSDKHVSQSQLTRLLKKALTPPTAATSTTTGGGGTRSGQSSGHASLSQSMEDSYESDSYASSPIAAARKPTSSAAAPPQPSSKPAASAASQQMAFHIPGSEPDPAEDDFNHLTQEELDQKKREMNKRT